MTRAIDPSLSQEFLTRSCGLSRSMSLKASLLIGAAVLIAQGSSAFAQDDLSVLFTDAKPIADIRYRYEYVDQAGFALKAKANTVRARIGVESGEAYDLRFLAELEAVGHMNDEFNDTVNGNVAYPVVADPKGAELNRLQLTYKGIPDTTVTVGRQRIALDTQRFVGPVGWRQNEQTFDAVRVTNTSIEGLQLDYMFLIQVNRIFGNESPAGEFTGETHLINASYNIPNLGKISAYGYLLDLEEAVALSTQTFGVRFAGSQPVGNSVSILYAAEYAHQTDYADNPFDLSLNYWAVEGGVKVDGFSVVGGVESLEGNGTRGFSTPLATLHAFQGWADVFLATPANGVVDIYGKASYSRDLDWGMVTGFSTSVVYHDFEAERGGASFGSEIDFDFNLKFGKHVTAGVKFADYDGDGAFADRKKVWFSVGLTY